MRTAPWSPSTSPRTSGCGSPARPWGEEHRGVRPHDARASPATYGGARDPAWPARPSASPHQRRDTSFFEAVLETITVSTGARGRPRTRPERVLADKAYTSKANRDYLTGRGIKVTIPERADQKQNRARRGSKGGRPRTFDRDAYKGRNVVERCFNRLKQWRGIATRSDKTARSYLAGVTFAAALIWIKSGLSNTP